MQSDKRQVLIFSLKIWLTTAIGEWILGLLLTIASITFRSSPYPKSMLYHEFLHRNLVSPFVGSLIIMIPLGVSIYYALSAFNKRTLPIKQTKVYLSITGIVFAVIPSVIGIIYILSLHLEEPSNDMYLWDYEFCGICYALIAVISVLVYKIELNKS